MVDLITENYEIYKEIEKENFSSIKIIERNTSNKKDTEKNWLQAMLEDKSLKYLRGAEKRGNQLFFSINAAPISLRKGWTGKEFSNFFKNLSAALKEADDHLIEMENIIFHKDYIFESQGSLIFICLPQKVYLSLDDFLKEIFFIGKIKDRGLYLPALLAALNNKIDINIIEKIAQDPALEGLEEDEEKDGEEKNVFKFENKDFQNGEIAKPEERMLYSLNESIESNQKAPYKLSSGRTERLRKIPLEEVIDAEERRDELGDDRAEQDMFGDEKEEMSLFYLLTHFSKENLEIYRSKGKEEPLEDEFFHNDSEDLEGRGLIWEEDGNISLFKGDSDKELSNNFIKKKRTIINEERLVLSPLSDQKIIIDKFPFSIGREAEKVDFCLSNRKISALHAQIEKAGDSFFLFDCASYNASFINNKRLIPFKKYPLKNGDRIRLADWEAVILKKHNINI